MLEKTKERWRDYLDEHSKVVEWLQDLLPPLNYITIHYAYFIIVIVVSSLIFWGSSSSFNSVDYVDSLFLVTSALTTTGLNTTNLSQLTTWQQVQLWFLFMIGSPLWISFWTVIIRRYAFEKRFEDIVQREREKRKNMSILRAPNLGSMLSFGKHFTSASQSIIPGLGSKIRSNAEPSPLATELAIVEARPIDPVTPPAPPEVTAASNHDDSASETQTVTSEGPGQNELRIDTVREIPRDRISFVEPTSPKGGEAHTSAYQPGNHLPQARDRRQSVATSVSSDDGFLHWKKILGSHNVTKKGQFFDLSSDEREHLGGCEYRALKMLSIAVPLYSAIWQISGAIALGCWVGTRHPDPALANSQNPIWAGIFYAVSAFNNIGMSLVDDSVIPYKSDYFVQLVIALLVLAGNTAYPVFFRFSLWSALQILRLTTKEDDENFAPWKETLEFILKYPRRVYTTLFPSRATWWLVLVLFVTNISDWVAFEVLNIGNPAVTALSLGDKIMNGLFQGVVVRAAGFTVISITALYIGVQVLYLVMMYIAAYPVIVTMRSSNVYEERSLGIYEDDPSVIELGAPTSLLADQDEVQKPKFLRRRKTAAVIGKQLKRATTSFQGVGAAAPAKSDEEGPSRISFVRQQIRGQLAHDLWWLVAAILIIVIIETRHFLENPVTYSVFNILFEATSAYACVGLSPGLPTASYSLSGGLYKGSKVVLVFVMLRGRHRGLPVAIDRAVRLPGEKLIMQEEEDSRIRRTKTMQRMMSRESQA
ncbi:unnamed protein product [Clonostachys chloroleuca]|uniref:Potassium transport protein n=1 Tax=Clonostachys chloroleuca TaxID=1926264 RepID=A0AA35PVD8_9HYPO|nr:unnamed protein product [Clonostachys chloroleuca]